jgi:hypothetical protein
MLNYDIVAISRAVGAYEGVQVKGMEMACEIPREKISKPCGRCLDFSEKKKPHIVHTHTPKAGIVGIMAACFALVPF